MQLVLSNSRDARRNLYLVLFDYVLHQINEMCIATGVSEYSDEEVQPIANLLILADASEAFHISVKLGVEGIIQLLRRSVSTALSRCPNSDRLIVVMPSYLILFIKKLLRLFILSMDMGRSLLVLFYSNEAIMVHKRTVFCYIICSLNCVTFLLL